MTIEIIFYAILTINIITDLFFSLHESLYEKTVFDKIIPGIKTYAPPNYDWKRELDYKRSHRIFGIISGIIGYVATILIFGTGIFSKIMFFLQAKFPEPFWAGFVFACLATLCLSLYKIPFSFYHSFVLEEKYGFNRKNCYVFLKDHIISIALSLVILPVMTGSINYLSGMKYGIPLIFAFIISLSLLFSFVFPILIMPLFYRIRPLEEGDLLEKVKEMIKRTGLSVTGIFTADQSKRSSHANAMVAGFGKSRKIILFDTLLERMDNTEVISVLAHEMGHWKEKHVLILLFAGIIEQALLFLFVWFMWNSAFTQSTFGIEGMTLARLIVILFILSSIMSLGLSPMDSFVSRKLEFRADSFAAKHAGPEHFSKALSNLATNDLAWIPPSNLNSLWFSSHPSIPERILNINQQS